jgi:hypothetical protein
MSLRRTTQRQLAGLLILLAMVALGCAGCASDDNTKNVSQKPWASPEGYQNGALGGLMGQPHH